MFKLKNVRYSNNNHIFVLSEHFIMNNLMMKYYTFDYKLPFYSSDVTLLTVVYNLCLLLI